MVNSFTGIASIPNELLINVLSLFSTRRLLPLACTCHRFHDLIIRIIHHRLIAAASLKNHKLILECFHPSTKLITPYALCNYLGTDGLSDDVVGEGDIYKDVNSTGRLGKMAGLYSRFRPLQSEERIRHLAGSARSTLLPEPKDGLVSQMVDLESHELFSQLCTITNIVKVGPKRGLFLSCVNIGEGVIRVFRDWLSDRDEANKRHIDSPEERENRLLWTDAEKHVGLKFKVSKWEEAPAPILLHRDEEAPVFYKLQYEELVLRTTQLLLHVEESLTREVGHSSKAIVIGSWDY